MQLVKSHINSIPVTGSHYRRSDLSNAKYIEASVTSKRQLYEFYKVSHNYHFKFKCFFLGRRYYTGPHAIDLILMNGESISRVPDSG